MPSPASGEGRALGSFPDLAGNEALRHFYVAEAAGQLDQLDPAIRVPLEAHVGRLREVGLLPEPGVENWDRFSAAIGEGQVFNVAVPTSATSTTETKSTTDLAPGQPIPSPIGRSRAGLGQMIGGTAGGMAAASMASPVPFLPLVAGPAGAYVGGQVGELAQAGLERATGALPSRTGTPLERADVAGKEAGTAEVIVQALGLPFAVVPFLRSLTPTARIAIAEQMAARQAKLAEQAGLASGTVGRAAEETARAGGMQAVTKAAPGVRQQATRAIDETTAAAQQWAAAAEKAMPKMLRTRSDALAGPLPPPYQPPARTLGGQPGSLREWLPPAVPAPSPKPLGMPAVSPAVAAPRRVLERVAGEAENVASLLQPIRDQVGDLAMAQRLARSPDAASLLLSRAQSDDERRVIEWVISGAEAAGREGRTIPSAVAEAARRAAEAEGRRSVEAAGTRTALGRTTAQLFSGLGGAALGSPFGFLGSTVGAAAGVAVEAVTRRVMDRMLNSPLPPAMVSSFRDALARPAAQYSMPGLLGPATRP